MESVAPTAVVLDAGARLPLPTTPCSAPSLPEQPCPVCPRLAAEFEPYRRAAYWQAMHQRAVAREALLQAEIDQLRAQLRQREHQLFGHKAETGTAAAETLPLAKPKKP